jgi:hypothetical protein
MNNYLSSADMAIWLALIASKLILCLCILKSQLFRRLPFFSTYVFAFTVKSLLLFAIASWGSYSAYYYAFYIAGYVESALAFVTLIECARRVLPGLNLPQRENAFALLFVALAAVTAFAAMWPLRSIANEKRIELGCYLAVAVAFIFVAVYSRYLGLYWSRLLAGIGSTLGLLYLVQGAAKAMIGHYPASLVLQVRQLGQIADVLAIVAWIVVVLSPWGVREYTEADILKIEAAFARIEAGLGTGEVKTV